MRWDAPIASKKGPQLAERHALCIANFIVCMMDVELSWLAQSFVGASPSKSIERAVRNSIGARRSSAVEDTSSEVSRLHLTFLNVDAEPGARATFSVTGIRALFGEVAAAFHVSSFGNTEFGQLAQVCFGSPRSRPWSIDLLINLLLFVSVMIGLPSLKRWR
jgi:hypothetical protein